MDVSKSPPMQRKRYKSLHLSSASFIICNENTYPYRDNFFCKKIRKTMTSSESNDVDRLSDLPDDIILKIFSSLTTENTITTSVLSRRWKGMWTEMRNLKFDSKFHQSNFSDHVVTALLTYRNPNLQSLTIAVKEECDPIDLATWVAIAFAKHVSKLVLRLENLSDALILPDNVLKRRNTMNVLKLMGRIYINLRLPTVSLYCLRELHLYHVRFNSTNSLSHLLGGCSVLKILVIVIYITSGILNITIDVPSLLKLTLKIENCVEENLVIKTPKLEYLDMKELECVNSIVMQNAPKLSTVKICRHGKDMDENILDSIPSVEQLTIAAPLKYPIRKKFYCLKTLTVGTKEDEWCNLLIHMLTYSPNLECLNFCGGWYRYRGATWTRPQYVPTCLASRIHSLQWQTYIWGESDEKEVAIFILENAQNLKNATFTLHTPTNDTQSERSYEMVNKLSEIFRASPSCHLVFEYSEYTSRSNNTVEDADVLGFSY